MDRDWGEVKNSVRVPARNLTYVSVYDLNGNSIWDSVRNSVRGSIWDSIRVSVCYLVWDSIIDSMGGN